jgi:Zn-dependent metalloprotease
MNNLRSRLLALALALPCLLAATGLGQAASAPGPVASSSSPAAASSPDQDALNRIRFKLGNDSRFRSRPVASTVSPAATPDPRASAIAEKLAQLGIRGNVVGAPAPHAAIAPGAPQGPVAAAQPAAADRAARQRAALQRLLAPAKDGLEIHLRSENGTVRHARGPLFPPQPSRLAGGNTLQRDTATARGLLTQWRDLLGVEDPDREFVLDRTESNGLGGRHFRFQQHWNGLRVWPASLSLHVNAQGQATILEGAYNTTPAGLETRPKLSAEDAILQARAGIDGGLAANTDVPQLVVYGPLGAEPRLAWGFQLNLDYAHAWLVFVDALDGRILAKSNRTCDANVAGKGVDLDGVTRDLNVWSANNNHFLIDTSKTMYKAGGDPVNKPEGAITIADARNKKIKELQGSDLFLITSANPASWTIADGVSAAFNFSQTYDYFLAEHQRNSLDGNGGNITAVVRVGEYDNASWNGNLKIMLFGNVRPYAAALDIVGHELTHGLIESSAGLVYENQSGAMNEAFADIFGEMVEARVAGQPDWKLGTRLGEAFRDFKQPGSLIVGGLNRPYPSKMSEFFEMPNDDQNDHGGVHINSSIINHCFWLAAEGLPGALGRRDAEKIFFRTLTQHLQPQSRFIDARLGAIASAEALFGKDSTHARKIAEAFDATEILSAPETPPPPTVPVVQGPDSTLFVSVDAFFGDVSLYRQENSLGDGAFGAEFAAGVRPARPAVTGDGTEVLYVSADNDLCYTQTANPRAGGCLGFSGQVHSVALAPDGTFGAFVFRDILTGQPDNRITVLDLAKSTTRTFELLAPALDGIPIDAVLYADSMTFSTDSQVLIYDAVSRLHFGTGPTVERWSIYALHLETGKISIVVPPIEGVDTGNPNMGRAGNRYLVFDAGVEASGNSVILTLDLFTGDAAQVGVVQNGYGVPCFTGDEGAVVYAQRDQNAFGSGFSLVRQSLAANRLGAEGNPTLWMEDASIGVLYRRGAFNANNTPPTVAITSPAPGANLTPGAPVTFQANATDADGTVASVAFYDGDDLLGEDRTAPFSFTWTPTANGSHRLIARATDNLGSVQDSIPVVVSVGSTGPATAPQLAIERLANGTPRITVKGSPGSYILSRSTDLRQWTDLPAVTVGAGGTATSDDPAGPAASRTLFYRARTP